MKLGLITDIHEHVEYLRSALADLERYSVDQIVVIGDIFELGNRILDTCELLTDAKAVGVWGNHDFGLCDDPPPALRQQYGNVVVDFMSSLQPRLEIDGCLFQHVEPWLDPKELTDLWYFDGIPDTPGKIARVFRSTSHRLCFAGHYHGWLMVTPDGLSNWTGNETIRLTQPQRYFVVIGALCHGRFAVFDTETCELIPREIS